MQPLVHEALGRFWHASVDVLEVIAEEEGRWCYRALTDRGCLFVKLQWAACGPGQEILNGLRIQAYIARHGLPTSEILLSVEGLGYAQLDGFPALPRVLVHSDITWGNVPRSQDGPLVLIDLEGAGIGPAVMDLVEVTTKLCLGPSASGPLQTEATMAFYAGYREHRLLSSEEVMTFSDAHFFHQFFYLVNSLQREDFGFIDRMEARLANWENGILNRLTSAAHGILR
ncbi:MAG: phosphotransferase [Gemmatimonadetes bacterium]|nr:phosphotransferase [Gemmatimonadota bacterium]